MFRPNVLFVSLTVFYSKISIGLLMTNDDSLVFNEQLSHVLPILRKKAFDLSKKR